MTLIDLTHTFIDGMPVYPGDPKPEIAQTAFLEKQGFNDFSVKTGMHVGTHIDAPLHFIADGKKLSDFGPDAFIGRGVLIDASTGSARGARDTAIDSTLLKESAIGKGDIVVVYTGWGAKYRESDYFTDFPVLTEDFASAVVAAGAKMIVLDTCSPDTPPYAVHKMLLGADVLIVENATNLEKLVGVDSFEIIALPPRFGTEAAPVRVVAQIP
jgi:kynurenine formamidase